MHEEFSVPPSFWEQLAPVWDKKPALIKNALPMPIASAAEMFEAICSWADAVNEQGSPYPSVYVDGAELPTDLQAFLPSRRDASLGGFARRLQQDLSDRDFQIYFKSAVHKYHGDIGVRCREVLMSLPKHLGIPPGGVEVEAFCGMYTRTGTGIHRDNSDDLSFIVDGKKTMLFWPSETFSHLTKTRQTALHERLGTTNYEEHLAQAIRISGEPGDVIYWPRSYWHMAISEEREWSMTLNLAMWWNLTPRSAITSAMHQAGLLGSDGQLQAYPLASGREQDDAASLPEVVSDALDSLRRAVNSPVLDQIVKEMWARIVTGGGLIQPPKPLPKSARTESGYVCGDPKFPIVILPVNDQVVNIVCAGNALRVRRWDGFDGLVEVVRSGETVPLNSLLEGAAGGGSAEADNHAEEIDKLLDFLIGNRALRIVQM